MRKLILSVCILLCAGVVFGQSGGYIGIYSDWNYVDCHLYDGATALHPVYVVHQYAPAPGVTASQFRVEASAGMTMTYIAETSHMATTIGDSQAGVCLFYESCLQGPILLMSINYFGTGTSAPCSELRVVPYPGLSSILAVDCSETVWQVGGGVLYVNSDGSCGCYIDKSTGPGEEKPLAGVTAPICMVPVETQSWGRVKALYR